jgi:hypothetical protein
MTQQLRALLIRITFFLTEHDLGATVNLVAKLTWIPLVSLVVVLGLVSQVTLKVHSEKGHFKAVPIWAVLFKKNSQK